MSMQFSLITLDASRRLLVFWKCNVKSTWYFWTWHFTLGGNVTINQLTCTERFKAVNQMYIYKFIHIYERQKEKERKRERLGSAAIWQSSKGTDTSSEQTKYWSAKYNISLHMQAWGKRERERETDVFAVATWQRETHAAETHLRWSSTMLAQVWLVLFTPLTVTVCLWRLCAPSDSSFLVFD